MHKKIQIVSKKWAIPRKKRTYLAVPNHTNDMPIVVVIRDILKLADNRKEVKKILNSGSVLINERIVRDEKHPACLLDILTIGDKKYKVSLSKKGKFEISETKEAAGHEKVIGKKLLKGGKIQVNLASGRNILTDKKIGVGDSIIIKGKNIEVSKLEKGANVLILGGKHAGHVGKVKEIEGKIARISFEGQDINVLKKLIMVV
jgi:small subunit ribosomal protein S4e